MILLALDMPPGMAHLPAFLAFLGGIVAVLLLVVAGFLAFNWAAYLYVESMRYFGLVMATTTVYRTMLRRKMRGRADRPFDTLLTVLSVKLSESEYNRIVHALGQGNKHLDSGHIFKKCSALEDDLIKVRRTSEDIRRTVRDELGLDFCYADLTVPKTDMLHCILLLNDGGLVTATWDKGPEAWKVNLHGEDCDRMLYPREVEVWAPHVSRHVD